jgi:hypothetical protein
MVDLVSDGDALAGNVKNWISKMPDLKHLARQYFSHRKASDDAFRCRDGASSTGHAAVADFIARSVASYIGLSSTDLAVAEMRKIVRDGSPSGLSA